MFYSIPLNKILIDEYKTLLVNQNLLPSRQILWQDIDANFFAIEKQGIHDLAALQKAIANPAKISAFAMTSGISADYLNILRREIGSLNQKPVKLVDFPGLEKEQISILAEKNITTSKDVFECDSPLDDEITSLCHLVRINGVGTVAARLFFDAGYHSISDIAAGHAAEMKDKIRQVNAEKSLYKANLGEKDMQFCIDAAALLLKYE